MCSPLCFCNMLELSCRENPCMHLFFRSFLGNRRLNNNKKMHKLMEHQQEAPAFKHLWQFTAGWVKGNSGCVRLQSVALC